MRTAIAKWGNSLALRLPKHAAEAAGLSEGKPVDVEVQEGTLIIRPVRKRYHLAELLARHKPKHRHKEIDWGESRGNEEW